jgi:hypothetical protein
MAVSNLPLRKSADSLNQDRQSQGDYEYKTDIMERNVVTAKLTHFTNWFGYTRVYLKVSGMSR